MIEVVNLVNSVGVTRPYIVNSFFGEKKPKLNDSCRRQHHKNV
jgi:hypothetical protein